jgi:hypothetical protein
MRKIAANTDPLFVALRCGSVASRMVIAEPDAVMHVIADGLHALPSGGDRSEQCPGEVCQLLRVAIPAAVKERQDVVRQVLDFPPPCAPNDLVRQAAVADQEVGADLKT